MKGPFVQSPICSYQAPCPRKGKALYGPVVDTGRSLLRSIQCVTCGATGTESTRTDLPGRPQKES